MASTRCPNCNFLNFDTAAECKKCKQPFGAIVPEAAYAGFGANGVYQTAGTIAPVTVPPSRPATSFLEPPPPNFYDDLRSGHPAANVDNNFSATVSVPPACAKRSGAAQNSSASVAAHTARVGDLDAMIGRDKAGPRERTAAKWPRVTPQQRRFDAAPQDPYQLLTSASGRV